MQFSELRAHDPDLESICLFFDKNHDTTKDPQKKTQYIIDKEKVLKHIMNKCQPILLDHLEEEFRKDFVRNNQNYLANKRQKKGGAPAGISSPERQAIMALTSLRKDAFNSVDFVTLQEFKRGPCPQIKIDDYFQIAKLKSKLH